MSRVKRRWLLLLAVALAPFLLYLLADTWLESSGGRETLERELARRAGLPVYLLGDFDVMLLPALGVEGTDLVIGGSGTVGEVVRSREYSVALALGPLLAGELRVDSVRLRDGALRLDHLPPATTSAAGEPRAALRLPAVEGFTISDFVVVAPGEDGFRLELERLTFEGFAERRDTTFDLVTATYGRFAGQLRWDPAVSVLRLGGAWSGVWPGELEFRGEVDFTAARGSVAATWPARPAAPGEGLSFATGFEVRDAAVRFDAIEFTAGTQSVRGHGCLLLEGSPALQLDLAADTLDLDRLPEIPSLPAAPGAEGAPAALGLDLRLTAGEIHKGGAVARQAVLSLGDAPECGEPD